MQLKPFVVLTLVLSFALAARGEDAKDGDTIEGAWLPSTAELAGKTFPEEVRKPIKSVVKDDRYTVTVGKATEEGTVKLKPTAKPKEWTSSAPKDRTREKTILAIYERWRHVADLLRPQRQSRHGVQDQGGHPVVLVSYKREP